MSDNEAPEEETTDSTLGQTEVVVPESLTAFRQTYPASAWLVDGFELIPRGEQLDQLIGAFLLTTFQWTGNPTPSTDFLDAGGSCVGDCGTIAGAFVTAA